MWLCSWDWKIEPSPAMPVAIPTCRKVLLAPEAMPLRSGGTTEMAEEARHRVDRADADAGHDESG